MATAGVVCETPVAGVSYPMVLGDTFLSDDPSHTYCSVRYEFKPVSAGRFRQGLVHLQDSQVSR